MKIAIIGTHGVGKTTLLNAIKEKHPKGFYIEEVARGVIAQTKHPNKMNKAELAKFEFDLLDAQIKAEEGKRHFISDRSVLDIWAYTQVFLEQNLISPKGKEGIIKAANSYLKTEPYDLLIYIPIEFPLIKDGVRFEGNKMQRQVDNWLKKIMARYVSESDCKLEIVKGNLQNRLIRFEHIIFGKKCLKILT